MRMKPLHLGVSALAFALASTTASANEQPAAAPAAAEAAAAPAFEVGAAVSDPKGEPVGTIEAIEGDFIILSTGTNKVRMPASSFAQYPTGPVIGMTRAEIDAAAGEAANGSADLDAILVPGATVRHTDGSAVGRIDAVEGDLVTLTTATGQNQVRLPKTAFAKGLNGPIVAISAAELDAAAAEAANGEQSEAQPATSEDAADQSTM